MKINNQKIKLTVILTLFNLLVFAAGPPIPGGGGGPTTPGAPASPIDMYILLLAAVAIIFAIFFAKRYATQQAK